MTPTPAQMPGPQGVHPAPGLQPANWWTWSKPFTDSTPGMPDHIYDSLRQKFFDEQVTPSVLQGGYGLDKAREDFMAHTERPGKAANPRLDTILSSAASALTAPISGLNPNAKAKAIQASIDQKAIGSAQEASRQGINPIPYQFAGQALGSAPYFAEGLSGLEKSFVPEAAEVLGKLGASGAVDSETLWSATKALQGLGDAKPELQQITRALSDAGIKTPDIATITSAFKGATPGKLAMRGVNALGLGVVQGAYDAASAPDLQRMAAFGKGAAMGAALGGLFEGAGALKDAVLTKSPTMAAGLIDSTISSAKGLSDEAQASQTVAAQVQDPGVGGSVAGAKADALVKAQKLGVARDTTTSVPSPIPDAPAAPPKTQRNVFQVSMTTADGKPLQVSGNMAQSAKMAQQIADHLKAGGSVESWSGDPRAVRAIQNKLVMAATAADRAAQTAQMSPMMEGVPPIKAASLPVGDAVLAAPGEDAGQVLLKHIADNPNATASSMAAQFKIPWVDAQRVIDFAQRDRSLDETPFDSPDVSGQPKAEGEGPRASIDPLAVPIFDQYKQLPSGEIVNHLTGEVWDNKFDFEKAQLAPEPSERWHPPTEQELLASQAPKGYVRGSADIPLSLNGQKQVQNLAQQISSKGGFDTLEGANLKRHVSTVRAISDANPSTQVYPPDQVWQSHALGEIEGQPHSSMTAALQKSLVENPDFTNHSMGPQSTRPMESVNEFKERFLGPLEDKMNQLERAGGKHAVVTSSTDIGLVASWLKKNNGLVDARPWGSAFDINNKTFLDKHENPGAVYRLAPNDQGKWSMRAVDMNSAKPFDDGVYLVRHGETIWNKDAVNPKITERPSARRVVGASVELDGASGIEFEAQAGRPTIVLRDAADRATVFHENTHAVITGLKMRGDIADILQDPMSEELYAKAFHEDAKAVYDKNPSFIPEEVFTHGAEAIRMNDEAKMKLFADADDGMDHWLGWMTDKTHAILDTVAEKEDSIYKRKAQRMFGSVVSRATSQLDDIYNNYSQAPGVELHDGMYAIHDGAERQLYSHREEFLSALDEHGEPFNAPELVNNSLLPDHLPRYSRDIRPPKAAEPPIASEPPTPGVVGPDTPQKATGGLQLFSSFFRPMRGWLATVAEKNNWPELYNAFEPLDKAQVDYNNFRRPYDNILRESLAKLSPARLKDFMSWYKTDDIFRPAVEEKLRFTPGEKSMLQDLETSVISPLKQEFGGLGLRDYIQSTLPKLNSKNGLLYEAFPKLPSGQKYDFMTEKLRKGALDPNENNLGVLLDRYIHYGAQNRFINPLLEDAQKVIEERVDSIHPITGQAERRAGNLYPVLNRHIEYLRGVPDYSAQILTGAVHAAQEGINAGIRRVNESLPTKFQIPEINELSSDPLAKFTLFQYAGALALKPATLIRDGIQLFITGYPVAGNYAFKGMNKAFGAMSRGEADGLWDTAQKYGALIERNDLSSLYATTDESPTGKAARFAQWALNLMQFTHNSNRLVMFEGHTEQMLDALAMFKGDGDPAMFARRSGLWFADKPMREALQREAVQEMTREQELDFARRGAKELVELGQWNFKRGANPGLYEYQVGRLFGQYGTWPLNYIEYARRFMAAEDKVAARSGLTKLILSHGAIMTAGQAFGVDTGRWVFLSPMAYEGGPAMQALTDLPASLSSTQRGEEARKDIRRMLFPGMIPGGTEASELYGGLTSNDPHWFPKVMGFHVMNDSDYHRFPHDLLPGMK